MPDPAPASPDPAVAASEPHDDLSIEPEPLLSYAAFGSDVPGILGRDAATCLRVSDKLLALGTRSGAVHLLDYEGNKVRGFHIEELLFYFVFNPTHVPARSLSLSHRFRPFGSTQPL